MRSAGVNAARDGLSTELVANFPHSHWILNQDFWPDTQPRAGYDVQGAKPLRSRVESEIRPELAGWFPDGSGRRARGSTCLGECLRWCV